MKRCMERFSDVNWGDVVEKVIEVMDEIVSKVRSGRSLAEVVRGFRDGRR